MQNERTPEPEEASERWEEDADLDPIEGGTETVAAAGKRRWWPFGVAVLAAVFIGAGWLMWSVRRQSAVATSLRTLGAKLRYSDEIPFGELSPPLSWLRQWLGHDWAASLVHVNLGRADISDDDLVCFEKLPGVRFLWLQQTDVSNQGLVHLAGCTNMEELYLAETKVTNEGLASIAGMKQLKFLSLSGCEITDEGLDYLEGMENLVRLDMPHTRVTSAGVAKLQQKLPRTKIVCSPDVGRALQASRRDSERASETRSPRGR